MAEGLSQKPLKEVKNHAQHRRVKRMVRGRFPFGQANGISNDRLTRIPRVGTISNMKAVLLLDERHVVAENVFVELVVWRLGTRLPGSRHDFSYRLALVVDGRCVLRYDNESGKGDHRHVGKKEHPYVFTTAQRLLDDFWSEVDRWRF